MNYLSKCTDEQIGELMRCYAADYTKIEIFRKDNFINVEIIVNGIPEDYSLMDYTVDVYDWDDRGESCLHDYRQKMLEFFGNQYAIDFLLDC